MSTNEKVNAFCAAIIMLTLIVTVLFINGNRLGIRIVYDLDNEAHSDSQVFTERDEDSSWDMAACTIVEMGDEGIAVDGEGVYTNGNELTIVRDGYYAVSGNATNGRIIVDATKGAKVHILLDGVTISSNDRSCIRIKKADKVFLTLAEGSVNRLIHDGNGENKKGYQATISSNDNLTINGKGTLVIESANRSGIACDRNLTITEGDIDITAGMYGIETDRHFRMERAGLTISSGDDSIHAGNDIYIASGKLDIRADREGLEAGEVRIDGGDINIKTRDDAVNACGEINVSKDFRPQIVINGGSLNIELPESRDIDGLDSNGDIIINGGDIFISLGGSGDAVDYGIENGGFLEINGGSLMAAGGKYMLEQSVNQGEQCMISVLSDTMMEPGDRIIIKDMNGSDIYNSSLKYKCKNIMISNPGLQRDKRIELTTPMGSFEFTIKKKHTKVYEDTKK